MADGLSQLACTRIEQDELLDLGLGTQANVAANLAEMRRMNRWLGGLSALTTHLYPRLSVSPQPITLTDLGTGAADIPVTIARWTETRGLKAHFLALDWTARNLTVARRQSQDTPAVCVLRADANQLPFANNSVDFVISSLFLHHFSPEPVVCLLRSAFACARRSVIMTDLVRGWLPLLGFKAIQPIFARNFLTRHDGAVSIRRAYTPSELRQFAAAAGLKNVQVHVHTPWRMTLVADK